MATITKRATLLSLIAAALFLPGILAVRGQEAAPPGPTLASIQARGEVACGVNQGLFGFGYLDPNTGEIGGFDVDFCRALAIVALGDAQATRLTLHTVESGEAALLSGEIDILLRNVSETLPQDRANPLEFGPPNFYSGQTIMVGADSGLDTWDALAGKTLCTTSGEVETNLAQAMQSQGVEYEARTFDTMEAAQEAFVAGSCDAHSGDWVQLAVLRRAASNPLGYMIWEAPFTIEPFAPVYRYGDEQWGDIVEWTIYGLIRAEELGITSENIEDFAAGSDNLEITALLTSGPELGLAGGFMVEVIRQVGNYGEIYDRHLGESTLLRMPRGLNRLWRDGGLMYAPRWS